MEAQNRRARQRVFAAVEEAEVREGELGIFHFYNMGYILKGPRHAVALDVTDNPCAWTDAERERLAELADVFVLTHPHSDHYSRRMLAPFFAKGKPVVVPCAIRVTNDLVRIFSGDHDARVYTNLVRGAATDVIIAPSWNFPSNVVLGCSANPGFARNSALFLPSHFNELGHGVHNRESYWEAYWRDDRLTAPDVPWPRTVILYPGESILYRRSLKGDERWVNSNGNRAGYN